MNFAIRSLGFCGMNRSPLGNLEVVPLYKQTYPSPPNLATLKMEVLRTHVSN